MSWFRRHLGFDGFDLTIHVGVTVMLMSVVGISNGPEELFPVMATVSLVVLAVRRKIALKSGSTGHAGLTTGEMAAERVADLEERVAELESAQSRLFELEERLDFAERLLASPSAETGARALPQRKE